MTDFVALRSLMFAGECFFGASLILALAWLVARNGTASRRHLIWLGAFAAMLVLPILAQILPPGIIVHMAAEPAPVMTPMVTDITVATPAPAAPSIGLTEIVMGLLFVWLAGVMAIAARTMAGLFGLFLLHRRSVPYIPDGIDGAKFRGVRWQLRLRTAPGNEGPVTWGIFKSTVLLPKSSVRWSRDRLEAVLLHEVAHVRRRDSLARLIALIACAFYWPNPFVWTAAARMRREAEIAADDAVLTSGVRASTYAEQLVGLAREFSHERVSFAGVTLSMAERSTLKERVQSVLTPALSRSGVTKMDVLKVAALGVAVTAVLALARPCLAEAQDARTVVTVSKDVQVKNEPVEAIDDEAPTTATRRVTRVVPPEAPTAPEAPEAPPAPPSPPAPPAAVIPPAPPAHMTAEQRAEFHRAMEAQRAEWRGVEAELRRAHAEMRKALDDGHIRESVARAMAQSRVAIEQAKAINKADVQRAIAEAKVAESIAQAMEQARPAIERAAERASVRAAEAAERAQERAEQAKERAADAAEREQERAEQDKERAAEAAERAQERAATCKKTCGAPRVNLGAPEKQSGTTEK